MSNAPNAIWDALSEVAGRYRTKPAVCRGEEVWTYEQLLSRIEEMPGPPLRYRADDELLRFLDEL